MMSGEWEEMRRWRSWILFVMELQFQRRTFRWKILVRLLAIDEEGAEVSEFRKEKLRTIRGRGS
jgi:hypothetical protein